MYTKRIIGLLMLLFLVTIGYAQEKTRKQLREESKIEKIKQIAILVDSKDSGVYHYNWMEEFQR